MTVGSCTTSDIGTSISSRDLVVRRFVSEIHPLIISIDNREVRLREFSRLLPVEFTVGFTGILFTVLFESLLFAYDYLFFSP